MKLIKQLLCNHQYEFHRVTSGDENNYSLPYRKVIKCSKCEKFSRETMTELDWMKFKGLTK